jgi:general secretion pathway protein L
MIESLLIKKLTSAVSGPVAGLKSVWAPLRRVLAFSLADESVAPAKNVTVSIEKGVLSVAYATRIFSRIRVKGFKTYPVEEKFPGPESLASSVALAMNALGAPGADITLSIPKAWTIIKIAEFPSTVKDNISDVVSYEMDRLTPFSPGEVLYDFRILKENKERLSLLLVAVRADMINPYREALAEKGFHVSRVTLNLSGAGALCSHVDKCSDFVFVKVGDKEYEGAVFSDGSLANAFTGNFGSGDERTKLDTLVAEIESLAGEAGKEGKSPRVMVSLKDRNSSLGEMLKLRLTMPLRILEETDMSIGLRAREVPFDAAGGAIESLRSQPRGLNLLLKGQQEREKPPITLTIILIIALIAVLSVYLVAPVKIEGNRLQEIERQITMRKDEVRKVEALKKDIGALESEISSITSFKEDRPMALAILKELTTILPKTAWLSRARITGTTVEIEGYAVTATELLPKLEGSKYLKKVEFASPTFRDARMNADRFSIKMEIEGLIKKEEEKPKEVEKPKEGVKPKSEKK